MRTEAARHPGTAARPGTVVAVGILVTVAFVATVLWLMARATFQEWGPLLLAPALIALTLPALSRQAAREGDRLLFWLLVTALVVKLVGAVARYAVSFDIYGVVDATSYDRWGVELSEKFRDGDFSTGLQTLAGTDFIRFFTGVVYTVIGPSIMGGFLFYSWLGFWGLFLFYRAFVLAVPEGRRRAYAYLIFFLPSLVYWPSSIGKEAWMMFTLGLAALGAAHLLSGRAIKGLVLAGGGMWLAALVRPHVAGLMAVGIVAAYMVRRPREQWGAIGPLVKGIVVVALAGATLVLVTRAGEFLKEKGLETGGGLTETLAATSERTAGGGSEFQPSILDSPARAPEALLTVLFRPLIVEAHNARALVAGIESTFLLLLTLFWIRRIVAGIRSIRRQPYVALALVASGLLILALSSFSNFGILARERVQLLPFYLVLLCAATLRKADPDRVSEKRSPVPS